jgi:hypothetical protein
MGLLKLPIEHNSFAIKPDWEKDMVFRVSGGVHQPPFYRNLEMLKAWFSQRKSTTIHSIL